MRKMMNKKGFSLVELMIVVVIMGILIAVAIPLYGAITDNANAKTCSSNIKTIRNAVTNYYASNDQSPIPDEAALIAMTQDKAIPKCPLTEGDASDYTIYISTDGQCEVACANTHEKAVENEYTGTSAPTAETGSTVTWKELPATAA